MQKQKDEQTKNMQSTEIINIKFNNKEEIPKTYDMPYMAAQTKQFSLKFPYYDCIIS